MPTTMTRPVCPDETCTYDDGNGCTCGPGPTKPERRPLPAFTLPECSVPGWRVVYVRVELYERNVADFRVDYRPPSGRDVQVYITDGYAPYALDSWSGLRADSPEPLIADAYSLLELVFGGQ